MRACERAHQLLRAAPVLPEADDVIEGRRNRAMPEQTDRQVFVYLDFSQVQRAQIKGVPDDWMTRLRVECAAREKDGVSGQKRADALAADCYQVLASNPSLDDLAMDLVPQGMTWDTDEADTSLGVVQVLFDIKHRTQSTSVSAP